MCCKLLSGIWNVLIRTQDGLVFDANTRTRDDRFMAMYIHSCVFRKRKCLLSGRRHIVFLSIFGVNT